VDVYEEYGRNSTLRLRVTRSVGFFGPITVTWNAAPWEATSMDYSPLSGTLNFAEDQENADIVITILDDTVPEELEVKFKVFLNYNISTLCLLGAAAPTDAFLHVYIQNYNKIQNNI
jgi:hypothetical protein